MEDKEKTSYYEKTVFHSSKLGRHGIETYKTSRVVNGFQSFIF